MAFRSVSIMWFGLAWAVALFAGFAAPNTARAAETENVMLVYDASGSMWGQIDGVPKYKIARDVVGHVIGNFGANVRLGLMAYGHRQKGNCKDIETLLPVGPIVPQRYMTTISRITPKGKTPISAAVRMAAEAMRFREEKSTVILVSDGLETCNLDPCELAKQLEKAGVDFTVHVVGFDLRKQDTTSLRCLAEATGGKYLSADNAGELGEAIGQVVEAVKQPQPAPAPKPVKPVAAKPGVKLSAVYSTGGAPVGAGLLWTVRRKGDTGKPVKKTAKATPTLALAPGEYTVEVQHRLARAEATLLVPANGVLEAQLVLNAGRLIVSAVAEEGGEVLEGVIFSLAGADGKKLKSRRGGQTDFIAPAGSYTITAVLAKIKVTAQAQIEAGQASNLVLTLGAGIIEPMAVVSEGGEKIGRQVIFTIYQAKKDINGKRKFVTSSRGTRKFKVEAGQYYVTAKYGSALAGVEVVAVAGQAVRPTLVMGAGILKIHGVANEGGDKLSRVIFTVYEAKKNLSGVRKNVVSVSGGERKLPLPAGKYYVTAKWGNATTAGEIMITAGELNETVMTLNAGVLAYDAKSPDGKPAYRPYIVVSETKKNLEGKRKQITSVGGAPRQVKLPAGKYLLTAVSRKQKVEKEFEIKPGERTELTVTFSQ